MGRLTPRLITHPPNIAAPGAAMSPKVAIPRPVPPKDGGSGPAASALHGSAPDPRPELGQIVGGLQSPNRAVPTGQSFGAPASASGGRVVNVSGAQTSGVAGQISGRDANGTTSMSGGQVGPVQALASGNISGRPKTTVGERETLGRGVIEWGYDDFRRADGAAASRVDEGLAPSEMRARHFETLDDWRPLVDAIGKWRTFLETQPLVRLLYVLDCGAGGNCLYEALAAGLNQLHDGPAYSMAQMRDAAAEQLTEAVFGGDDGFFQNWDPPAHHTVSARLRKTVAALPTTADKVVAMRQIIRTPGNDYWGETETLRHLLLHAPLFRDRALGFAVLSIRDAPVRRPSTPAERAAALTAGKTAPTEVTVGLAPRAYTHILRLESTRHLMCLYNVGGVHWLLVGVAPSPDIRTVASTFPIHAYPAALFSFLRES